MKVDTLAKFNDPGFAITGIGGRQAEHRNQFALFPSFEEFLHYQNSNSPSPTNQASHLDGIEASGTYFTNIS